LYIGAASDFVPIGAFNAPFIIDPLTKQPIILGSSINAKLRTLLVKSYVEGYTLNAIENDTDEVKRLFGLVTSKNFYLNTRACNFLIKNDG